MRGNFLIIISFSSIKLLLIFKTFKEQQLDMPLMRNKMAFFNLLFEISKLIKVEFLDKALFNISNDDAFKSPKLL